jgi:hypothetical protein
MTKFVPDAGLDGGLTYTDGSNYECVCNAQPTTYAQAMVTYALATVAMAGGDITVADDANGRSATMAAKSAVSIIASGSATHIALVETSGSVLRLITTCTMQPLTSGGTVDIPTWKQNIQDPT